MKQTRNTVAKERILDVITNSASALSHAEIQDRLNGLCDRVTIYRVLDRLMAEDLVHKVVTLEGVTKYAACHSCTSAHSHNHVHFSCDNCKSVTCVDSVQPAFVLPEKYTVFQVNFTVSGLCPQCN